MDKKLVNILWTGGLDSSFRVVELSMLDVIIQPWYILDTVRKSAKNELRAIQKISNIIDNHQKTKAKLLPIRIIHLEEISECKEITDSFNHLHYKYNIGHQYDLIARYAKQHNIVFEMSLEKSDRSKAMDCLNSEATLNLYKIDSYSVYKVVNNDSSEDVLNVFENIAFPASLWNMTKQDEIQWLIKNGHKDTIKYTWFCHYPIFGLPCGHCNPCKDSIKEGLSFRVPLSGRVLYYLYKPIDSIIIRCKKLVQKD